ncbi:RBMX2 [Mytilus coruscus]|uniref:RNA-binding motif protein, X-linked 2 n=1 Tax=Mytilus coruscus TaxID=42192 RepID=A0A6J8A407_MYTCO|nr:RBMX2 [Mytilus coruscus]
MNPLTNVKNLQKINEKELELGLVGKKSWHDKYKDSAWIFVGGLPYDLTEGDVICVFSQYGEIVNINIVRDKKTGKIKGYGFLCYEDQRSTVLAVDNLNGTKVLGRTLRVDHVENYKQPKEFGDEDDITKQMRSEGCAPQLPQSDNSEKEEDSFVVPMKKVKKEKKSKKKKKEKKKKHKKSESSSDSENEVEQTEIPKNLTEILSHIENRYNNRYESKDRYHTDFQNGSNRNNQDRYCENVSNYHYKQSYNRGDNSRNYRRDRSRSPNNRPFDKGRDRSNSPPRRQERSRDASNSPPRRRERLRKISNSPPRRRGRSRDRSNSPSRRRERSRDRSYSPPKRQERSRDISNSPPRRGERSRDR